MNTIKTFILAAILLLSLNSYTFSAPPTLTNTSSVIQKFNYDEYVYINNVLYHIVYDDRGNVISCEEVFD